MLVAGGGLACSRVGVGRRKKRPLSQPVCNGVHSEIEVLSGKDSPVAPRPKAKKKRGGFKSLKILGGILLAQIGKPGMHNFLGLAAIAVWKFAGLLPTFIARKLCWLNVKMSVRLCSYNFFLYLKIV